MSANEARITGDPATVMELASFRNRHSGEAILVCGCGESIEHLQPPVEVATIGVNDVGRWLDPTYLVVVNPEGQFSRDRFEHIRNSRAGAIFTQFGNLPVPSHRRVLLRFGQYGGTDFNIPDVVHYTQNSPYVAVCLAVHMGARRVGLIGVDFGTRSLYCESAVHPLSPLIDTIDSEYAKLRAACKARGIEIFNLSPKSRLTALPPMALAAFLGSPRAAQTRSLESSAAPAPKPAILIVDYDFLTCGRVFGDGLARAATDLGVRAQTVLWSDPELPSLVERFKPDLIAVVHGRRFAERWGERFQRYNTAVWLLDEPYEVDDTARWSACYKTVFVNDRATLSRHRNAHYLPVCYDAHTHRDLAVQRQYRVGFVGGVNAVRERYLTALAQAGLLDYIVGGPWSSPLLRKITLAQKVSPAETTRLYQATQVVINVFREVHHFNRDRLLATALNPRVLEALACGAVVISERRADIGELLPELPQFDSAQDLVELVRRCLTDEERLTTLKQQCGARINGHAYIDRLATMLHVTLPQCDLAPTPRETLEDVPNIRQLPAGREASGGEPPPRGWVARGIDLEPGDEASLVLRRHDPTHRTHPTHPTQAGWAGPEAGLVSERSFGTVDLHFTVRFSRDAVLVAKIHQVEQDDPRSNSYHLIATATGSYLARQDQVLGRLVLRADTWIRLRLRWTGAWLEIWGDEVLQGRFRESVIASGYCFIGSKAGTVAVRSITIEEGAQARARVVPILPRAVPPTVVPRVVRGPAPGGALGSGRALARNGALALGGALAPANAHDLPPRLDLLPLGPATRRNLIYHIWPKRGSNWRWNVEQLLKRINLFNGKRVIGIVEDAESEPATAVMELLAEQGCEFLTHPNNPTGEAISFPAMLQKVASTAKDEVTFYGHAKGVKYGLPCPPNVQRWSEVLYRAALDDWPTVRDHLNRFGMTGSFRMPGRFASHRNTGDWHYSGTFFWMRHAAVFERRWQEVQEFYYGVEAWPGGLFQKEETGCLLVDDLRPPLPYVDEFWRRRGNRALLDWEARRCCVPIPEDLATPKPFDGFTTPRLEHKPEEFVWWVDQLKTHGTRRLLVIGSAGGGAEWHTARVFREAGLDIEITSIEPNSTGELEAAYEEARQRFQQRLHLLAGSPRDAGLRAQLGGPFDAVFIDGNHGYDQVRADFLLAQSLSPKLIGLHDIVDSDWHAISGCCVSRLWREIVTQYPAQERSTGEWAGIGILHSPVASGL